jgi:hypothetical protein
LDILANNPKIRSFISGAFSSNDKLSMRLYHSIFRTNRARNIPPVVAILSIFFVYAWLSSACAPPQVTQALIDIQIIADGQTIPLHLPAGSTVQQALDAASLSLNTLDRTEPPIYTVLGDKETIHLVRVTEEFEVEQVIIPFEYQTLRNESLPKDKEILIQKGKNGIKEITYRKVYEDGALVSGQPEPVKLVIVEQPIPEIRMIGIQAPFSSVNIPGRLIYLRDGNVWMMEGTTGNRRAVLTTGDLDGRVLSLSTDGSWLLFTRRSKVEGQINTLWAADIITGTGNTKGAVAEEQQLIDLKVANVIHFADWVPGSDTKIVFSTVEPRSAAPGWQANNDLNSLTFSTTGWTTKWTVILEANSGGVYGWWGTDFSWSPDKLHLAFTRPDSVGLINYKNGTITTTLDIVPLLTHRDWAWVPGITWGPDGNILYTVNHVSSQGAASPEESQVFDLSALPFGYGPALSLVSQTGMFAYPLASPWITSSKGEVGFQIAYLQAIFPEQSETSRYRLEVMDRDGSDHRVLFPPQDIAGFEPQKHWGAWSPEPMPGSGNYAIAIIYQGNLWLVDVVTGDTFQVTGDGLTDGVIWYGAPKE